MLRNSSVRNGGLTISLVVGALLLPSSEGHSMAKLSPRIMAKARSSDTRFVNSGYQTRDTVKSTNRYQKTETTLHDCLTFC